MEININKLPARTFNWLGMNETTVDVPEFISGVMKESLPCEVTCERKSFDESLDEVHSNKSAGSADADDNFFSAVYETGMGKDFDSLIARSKAESYVLKTKPGIAASEAVRFKIETDGENSVNSLIVNAAKDSSVTIVMDYAPPEGVSEENHHEAEDSSDMFGVQTRIEADTGSSVCLVQILRHGADTSCLNDIGAVLKDGASLNVIQLVLGGSRNYMGSRVVLEGDESSFTSDIGYIVENGGRLDMNYSALLMGKNTESAINAAGVLKDRAFKLFRGTIDFSKGAAGSVGNEKEDVLLLDDNVVNQTIPLILCAEEDVEGNHGATIGELGDELLLYMQSRGLSREQVYEEMSRARINAVCGKIPDAATREFMAEYLELRGSKRNGG